MMMHSVILHQTIGMKLLYLLQLALLESDSSKAKKECGSANPNNGIPLASTSNTSAKLDDKTTKKSTTSASQISKQEAKLCRSLTNKIDSDVLIEFVKVYLCEHEEPGVRWLAEAVLANMYK